MNNKIPLAVIILPVVVFLVTLVSIASAQFAGSRGGVESSAVDDGAPPSRPDFGATVQQYIEVSATVEQRVTPDQIRIVLAVTDQGTTPSECEKKVFDRVSRLRSALIEQGVPEADIVDDFIAVLPEYRFDIESLEGKNCAVEKKSGYHMQTNLHIRVPDDQRAMQAIRTAFAQDVADIIAFDYWSSQLNEIRDEVLERAINQAGLKADRLLDAAFDQRPRPVNIDASTEVVFPEQLYNSFENANAQMIAQPFRNRDSLPVIHAFRPKNTYYRGFTGPHTDRQSDQLPMQSEISVVANVRLYFASPVAAEYRQLENPPQHVHE